MLIKEENLIPVEGIKAGQRLIKIGETFVPIGFGGNFEPGAISFKEEGRDTYYKCASVSETTWDGYALVLGDGGYYTISETLTTGLSYGRGYTPKVDGVYNVDATISVGKYSTSVLETDLYFYLPLSEALTVAPTGQTLSTIGTPQYTTVSGVACVHKNNEENNNYQTVDLEELQPPFTVSFWINATETSGAQQVLALKNNNFVYSWYGYNTNNSGYYIPDENRPQNNNGIWMNIIYSINGTSSKIFVNGLDQGVDFSELPSEDSIMPADTWYINQARSTSYGWGSFFGYLSTIRIYKKAADESLVNALYSELNPVYE